MKTDDIIMPGAPGRVRQVRSNDMRLVRAGNAPRSGALCGDKRQCFRADESPIIVELVSQPDVKGMLVVPVRSSEPHQGGFEGGSD
jgi:hypothetical protein